MKIRKMTATFGRLDQATLAPSEGLTVISAPNEGGKSTWTGFLKAMLYGVDTRERDKNGVLADKNRYQPWSGAPMWGEVQLEWEGREITLRRTTNRSGPMQGFEAVYTASGDPVPELNGADAGQVLLGAGKDVFLRTALVSQNGVVVTQNQDLESRIAALATAGQEDASYSATERTLKDWRNRRKLNRSNGQIPKLEQELGQVEQTLAELKQARQSKARAEGQLNRLEEERRELHSDQEIHRRLAQKDLNRRYGQALEAMNEAQRKLEALPAPDPAFAGLTAREAREQARKAEKQARLRWEETARRQEELAGKRKADKARTAVYGGVCALAGLAALLTGILLQNISGWIGGIALLICAVVLMLVGIRRMKQTAKELSLLPKAEQSEGGEAAGAEAYAEWLARKDLLEQELRHCRERVEDLRAQGAREFDTLEMLHTPARSAAETAARLGAVEQEMTRWQTQLDQAIGALRSDPQTLESRRDELLEELNERTFQFDALELALKGMEAANALLRERFSPALNRATTELFSKLTGGKYDKVSLSREFSALASAEGAPAAYSAAYLSAGTVDQLYLAVRLALCALTLPDAPVVLDDALAAFDDGRAELALDCLKELAKERQILLFTCHSREARWAEKNGVPVIHM